MTEANTPPGIVMELAGRAKGTPIAWKEYPDGWTIVFEDGRKMQFERKGEATPPPAPPQMSTFGEGGKSRKKGGSQA